MAEQSGISSRPLIQSDGPGGTQRGTDRREESIWPAPALQRTSTDYDTVTAVHCSSGQVSTLPKVVGMEVVNSGNANRSRRQIRLIHDKLDWV